MRERFAVLFDMDGVIFDSEQAVLAVWRELADELSLPDIESVFLRCVGTNKARTEEIFRAAYPALDFARFDAEARRRFAARWGGGRLPRTRKGTSAKRLRKSILSARKRFRTARWLP